MNSLSPPLDLNVQFDGVSSENATHVVPAAADVPEFSASCGPLTTQLSCECDDDPCESPAVEPA